MNNIHVRVTGSKVKENGFSPVETPCWTVDLFNEVTDKIQPICLGMGELSRYSELHKAEIQARVWAEFLGCGIRYFEVRQRTITEHVEVFKTKREDHD